MLRVKPGVFCVVASDGRSGRIGVVQENGKARAVATLGLMPLAAARLIVLNLNRFVGP